MNQETEYEENQYPQDEFEETQFEDRHSDENNYVNRMSGDEFVADTDSHSVVTRVSTLSFSSSSSLV
jgi:hypothetical protein